MNSLMDYALKDDQSEIKVAKKFCTLVNKDVKLGHKRKIKRIETNSEPKVHEHTFNQIALTESNCRLAAMLMMVLFDVNS